MGLTVLIVDDERAPRELLEQFIPWAELGFDRVLTADNGEAGLSIVQAQQPDVIISDIKMPHMNGIKFAHLVRENWPQCRFVFLSAYPDKEHLKDAIKLKASCFIEKPIDLMEVEELLQELAEECRSQQTADPRKLFFRGANGGRQPLNDRIFSLSRAQFNELSGYIKAKKEIPARRFLEDLFKQMQACEGSNIEYIRNVFCRLVLLFSDAADSHGIGTVSQKRDHLLYTTAREADLLQLEAALTAFARDYFEAVCTEAPTLVDRVEAYLSEHYTNPALTVQIIADELGFVNTYLCNAYKKARGITINQRLTALRMKQAEALLRTTQYKFNRIAAEVGYSDPQYFTRVFTKEYGVSPRQYREEQDYDE